MPMRLTVPSDYHVAGVWGMVNSQRVGNRDAGGNDEGEVVRGRDGYRRESPDYEDR